MRKVKVLKILCILWFVIFITFSVIWFVKAPIICWDGINKATNEMIGGCYPDYTLAAGLFMFPCVFWLVTQSIVLILYFRARKAQTSIK